LNSTFWLSGPFEVTSLNKTFSSSSFVPDSKVHQENFYIKVSPLKKNSTLSKEVTTEINSITRNNANPKIIESVPDSIADNPAHKIIFTGIFNGSNPLFGNSWQGIRIFDYKT
jgi:hypothetical protein